MSRARSAREECRDVDTSIDTKQKTKWRSRLNRGLVALAVFVLLCAAFVVAARIYIDRMPAKMIALAEDYYETVDPAEGIPARIYQYAEIVQWEDLTHASVRVYGKLESGVVDLPFSESQYYELFDQFRIEFKGGKWRVLSVAYSFQGRRDAYEEFMKSRGYDV